MPSDKNRAKTLGIVALIVIIVAAGGLFIYKNQTSNKNPSIPADIRQKISFVVFYPTDKSIVTIDKSSIKYDEQNKLLIFNARTPLGTKLVFSQQATPESFVDIPTAFKQLIEKLGEYRSFDSASGKVSLTHPKELKGGQSAVLNSKGTLVFVRPKGNLTDDEWQKLFNNLQQQTK